MKYKKINLFDVILGLIILTAKCNTYMERWYKMNEVFETVAEVLEELRSEAEEREYSVHTNESENADKALKKANREYETVLTELSAEHREFFENYMDIVDHAHFQEEQRAYYQGMVDVMQIFDGLGILKERNKVKEVLMHIKK